jgi:hypothetical protein
MASGGDVRLRGGGGRGGATVATVRARATDVDIAQSWSTLVVEYDKVGKKRPGRASNPRSTVCRSRVPGKRIEFLVYRKSIF